MNATTALLWVLIVTVACVGVRIVIAIDDLSSNVSYAICMQHEPPEGC